jgi:light-regulated signal transduction histidine kinase (bacteriophytochrome)
VRGAPGKLDAEAYRALATPRRAHPISYYSAVEPGLFDAIIEKHQGQLNVASEAGQGTTFTVRLAAAEG